MKSSLRYRMLPAFLLASAAGAQDGGAAPAPLPSDFVEGERWEWRLTITPDVGANPSPTRTVVNTAEGLQFQNHRGKTDSFKAAFEANPFFLTKSLTPFREWPLEVGKTWRYEGEFMDRRASLKQTAKVVAFEGVTVPAGTFKAYKIEYVVTANRGGESWKRNDTHWYAPSVKADVKSTIDTPTHQGVMELVSYRRTPTVAK